MKPRKPIRRKRLKPRAIHSERTKRPKQNSNFLDSRSYVTKMGRVRLFGADYHALRLAVWERAGGWSGNATCECGCGHRAKFYVATEGMLDGGEISHNEHGPRKSDELSRVKWMRHECHMKSHNCGGKPNRSKGSK